MHFLDPLGGLESVDNGLVSAMPSLWLVDQQAFRLDMGSPTQVLRSLDGEDGIPAVSKIYTQYTIAVSIFFSVISVYPQYTPYNPYRDYIGVVFPCSLLQEQHLEKSPKVQQFGNSGRFSWRSVTTKMPALILVLSGAAPQKHCRQNGGLRC